MSLLVFYHGLTLNNVEDNHKLSNELESTQNALQKYIVQIDQIQERLQGSFTPSYISNMHPMAEIIYVTNKEPHMMVEHEVHVDMQVLKNATFKQEGNQALVLVHRDYEFPLGESCRALEEAHDLTTIVPANYG